MRNYKKVIVSIMAVLSIIAMDTCVPYSPLFKDSAMTAQAAVTTTWDIDDNGVMTISGIGEMPCFINKSSVEWDSRRSDIKKVIIESGVTSISAYAFSGCKNLESVVIPDTVTIINNSAFQDDTKLTSINIPYSVTEIYGRAFSNTGCSEIIIPDSVKELDGAVMADSPCLKKAVLPNGIKTIGGNMFYGCTNLTDIEIPSSVTGIGYYAFSGCSGLTSIEFPDTLERIDYNAFENCTGLTAVDIPASVTLIDDCAFQGCTSLESVKISNSETSVGQGAFSECTSLSQLDVPKDLQFAENAFVGDSALTDPPFTFVLYCGTQRVLRSTSSVNWKIDSDGTLTISGNCRMSEGDRVASFTSAWSNYRNIVTKIVFEEGIQSIAVRGFEYFGNLKEVVLPSTVTKICTNAFAHNPKLKRINFPEGLTEIDNYAFYGCESLEAIDLPSSLSSIGEAAFYCCYPIDEVVIPEGVTTISSNAFAGCNSMKKLTLPETLETIGFQAFFACGFEEVDIPSSVTTIDDNAFIDCSNLKHIRFKDDSKLTSIGKSAFNGCSSLEDFFMPDGVTVLRDSTFSQCTNLSELKLSNNLETIESSSFTFCNKLKKLYIPTSLKEIQKNVFYSTKNLTSIIYCGTKEQWEDITIGENNGRFHEMPQFHEYENDECSYCHALRPYSNTRFDGYSVTLDGSIGVNVYLSLDDEILSDENAYINFIMPDNSVVKAPVASAELKEVEGSEYYVFTCHVAAKDISNPITAQIALGDSSKIDTISFTVSEYAENLREHDPSYADFADKFIAYGEAAESYFSNTNTSTSKYTNEDYQRVASAIVPSEGITDTDYIGSSLLTKTNIVLRHYFSEDAPGRKMKYTDENMDEVVYYVEQTFTPAQFGDKISGYDYSIYDYIYKVTSSNSSDLRLKNLCVALYDYAEACKAVIS